MSGFLLAIIIISAALILAQWFVFLRIRTYLFQHYEPIKRKTAYLALGLIGILNIAIARVTLTSSLFGPDTFGKKFVEVAFFSYLGVILLLCLFFLIIGLFSTTLRLKDALAGLFRNSAGEATSRPLRISRMQGRIRRNRASKIGRKRSTSATCKTAVSISEGVPQVDRSIGRSRRHERRRRGSSPCLSCAGN